MTQSLICYHYGHPCGTATDFLIFLQDCFCAILDYTPALQHLDPLYYLSEYFLFNNGTQFLNITCLSILFASISATDVFATHIVPFTKTYTLIKS